MEGVVNEADKVSSSAEWIANIGRVHFALTG